MKVFVHLNMISPCYGFTSRTWCIFGLFILVVGKFGSELWFKPEPTRTGPKVQFREDAVDRIECKLSPHRYERLHFYAQRLLGYHFMSGSGLSLQ